MDIYLDHNATSLIDEDVLQTVIAAYRSYPGNPSSVHALGRKARSQHLYAKDRIAQAFKLSSKEVFFTSSATSALNWILFQKPYRHIISSNLEHAATYSSLKKLQAKGTLVTFIGPGAVGSVSPDLLIQAITPQTDLIILGAANSETGIIQPIDELAACAKSHNIPFFVDAVGHLGRAPMTFNPHVTGYIISSHKIHGPKGIAALIHKNPEDLIPLTYGGFQEGGKHAGTENLPSALGFAHSFEKALKQPLEQIRSHRDYFEQHLKQVLPVTIIGEDHSRVDNTSCVQFHDLPAEALLQLLDHHHIYTSYGSACSSGALEPSRVLLNMGLNPKAAKECLRFSLSKYTTLPMLDHTLSTLITLSSEIRKLSTF